MELNEAEETRYIHNHQFVNGLPTPWEIHSNIFSVALLGFEWWRDREFRKFHAQVVTLCCII